MTLADEGASRRRAWFWVFLLCLSAYTLTWPGRITFPDDEVQFRTAEALYERGSFVIEPMEKRTGELDGRPTGSFGVAFDPDDPEGKLYGFFGQGLALASVPFVAVGDLLHDAGFADWRYSTRSDTQRYAARTPRGDLRRFAVTWSSCLWTATAACVLGVWLQCLGLSLSAALFGSLGFALGSAAWSYTSTFLSEPLSSLCLLTAFWQAERYKQAEVGSARAHRALIASACAAGFALHVHVLNLLAVPFVLAYAWLPARRSGRATQESATWWIALAIGAVWLVALGLSQWWRFGSPFTTGRFDHYAHWVLPFQAIAAFLIAPGRSLLLYAPPLVFGMWGLSRTRVRFSTELACVLGLVLVRATFVACRSDWAGGWSLGPRYLIPCVPLLMLPAALAWEEATVSRRRAFTIALAFCALVQAWLASHSIGEHMLTLSNLEGIDNYGRLAHWSPSSSPFAGFWNMDARFRQALFALDEVQIMAVARFDMVSFGSIRLWLAGRGASLLIVMGLWTVVGAIAGLALLRIARSEPKSGS